MGLVRAAERFDPTLKLRFSTYATWYVKAALRRSLQNSARVVRLPQQVFDRYRKIASAAKTLGAETRETGPTDSDISEELRKKGVQLPPEKVREIIELVYNRPFSLDTRSTFPDGKGGTSRRIDNLADSKLADEQLVRRSLRSDLLRVMEENLKPEQAMVISLHFGLEDDIPRSVRQVAEEAQIPLNRAKNSLASGLTKLRKQWVKDELREYLEDDEPDGR